MGRREKCPHCKSGVWDEGEDMFRAYIRKYDYNGKAKWIPKGWICEKCDMFVPDEKKKGQTTL